ncbi:MAG: hypothetical protein KAV25_03980 [Methanophagales archaeon]|nr:hypothetical protein [Methanophagales archaeon]
MTYTSGGRAVVVHTTNIWNSKDTIFYTYNGTNYTNYLGNYWDDYMGNDADGDGIGDTPYDIDSDKDNYPLMEPWENYFAPAPSVFEYTFEDFNDMITVTDTGFNDFSGNMGIVNKDGVPYIEAPLNISSLSQDEPGGSLRISYDFTKGDDEEAFAGIFMSLFGLTETQGTFDGETVEVINFSNYTIDFKNIFGELQETPKDVEYVRFYVKGAPAPEDKIILRVELKDNKGSTAYYRVSIPNINESWQEVEIPIESFIRIDNVDLHHMKLLNFIIERNNYAGNIHNPDKGTFYLDNIRFVDSDDSPKSLNEMSDDQFLDLISKRAFQYFLDWSSKDERSKGLIQDRSTSNDLLTIGGTGFYLTAMPIGIERGWISREVARRKVKETLEILADDRLQGPERMGKIGYRGFFYHFLGIDGKRKINFDYPDTPENENLSTVELSTIDTTLCLYGVLTCKEYFNGSHPDEVAIRDLADHIYKRVDWDFMLEPNSSQFYWAWKPNEEREGDPYEIPDAGGLGCYSGKYNYSGNISDPSTVDIYTDEAYLISLLAIGSPDHSVSPDVYCSWIRETDGGDFVKSYPGSLFTYFFASLWINTEEWGTDACSSAVNWYENSQKAILSSRNYCIVNRNFSTFGKNSWGLTACEGPVDAYRAYGARPCALNINSQVDEDGTIAPYGAGSVITFGDEIANYSVLALKHYYQDTDLWRNRFGLGDAYNLDVSKVEGINGRGIIRNTGSWCNHVGFAIDNGPLLIAIENYRSGLIWDLIRKNKYIRSALDKGYSIFTRECEYPDEYTVGGMIWRGGAYGSKVHGQFGCGNGYSSAKDGYVKYNTTELYSAEHLYLVLRYSKHSPSTTPIKIFLDEEANPRSSVIPENQGSWNKFAETDPIDLGKITEGTHTIKFSTEGQPYGVADLDKFTLAYLSK